MRNTKDGRKKVLIFNIIPTERHDRRCSQMQEVFKNEYRWKPFKKYRLVKWPQFLNG